MGAAVGRGRRRDRVCAVRDRGTAKGAVQPGNFGTKLSAVLKGLKKRSREVRDISGYDLVYVFREAAVLGPAWFEKRIARSGKPMIFDFDDAVFVPYRSPLNG